MDETFTWLDDFVSFLITESHEKLVNDKKSPILPNQNGIYKIKDELFLDDGEIDEELKDIAASLGYDIRDELLDKRIYLKLPDNRVRNQEAVADEISKLVKPLFAEFPRSPETRQIFKTLYLWFSENRETAQNIFSDLYKNKHKLYDDDEIAENMKKAEDLDDLLNSTGMSIEEIKKALEGRISPAPTVITEPATPNIQLDLIVLGIYDKSDLDRLLVDGIMSESFKHISGASQEMFEFVQNLIKRAIDNVKKHLLTLPEYDLSGWEPISTTVIGGIKKEGIPISLVIRPSDGGQVIFYYGPEKETLEHPRSELWVEDGKTQPQHLTLGRVLKTNRLDRIKV